MLCCASCNITGHLDLASNSLPGTLPSEVGFLTQLTYLGLFSNSLTGVIPSEIGYLSNLSKSNIVLLVMQIVAVYTIMLAIIFFQ